MSLNGEEQRRPVPWAHVVKLFRKLYATPRQLKGQSKATIINGKGQDTRDPKVIFRTFVETLPGDQDTQNVGTACCQRGTGAALFSLLFADIDTRRRYHYSERSLATALLPKLSAGIDARDLERWAKDKVLQRESRVHCVGLAALDARKIDLEGDSSNQSQLDQCTLDDVITLLDSIASYSPYSFKGPGGPRVRPGFSKTDAFDALFHNKSPMSWAILCQVLLYDVKSLFAAKERKSGEQMIKDHAAASVPKLELVDALNIWHPNLPQIYGVCAELSVALDLAEGNEGDENFKASIQLGQRVNVVRHIKSHSPACIDSLKDTRVWAEFKYDGERAQIHVDLSGKSPLIRIFSKSGRDSTQDRKKCHSIILAALGRIPGGALSLVDELMLTRLGKDTSPLPSQPATKGIILEAEMVAFDETVGVDAEFYRLRSMKGHGFNKDMTSQHPSSSSPALHHKLVFFDILYFDGVDQMEQPYRRRRRLLDRVIRTIPGFSMLAERQRIDYKSPELSVLDDYLVQSRMRAYAKLREVWAIVYANKLEGCVLKGDDSKHPAVATDPTHQWIKVKADYIPNFGDTLDLCIIGAGWCAKRGEILGHVNPDVLNTVHYGYITDEYSQSGKRRVEALDTCSWGLPATNLIQLTDYFHRARKAEWTSANNKMMKKNKQVVLSFEDYELVMRKTEGNVDIPPRWVLCVPIVGTFLGAGFTKVPGCSLYLLRWPRLQKWYHPDHDEERRWEDTVPCDEVQRIAKHAMQPSRDLQSMERDYLKMLRHISERDGSEQHLDTSSEVRERFTKILDDAKRITEPAGLGDSMSEVRIALHPQSADASAPLINIAWTTLEELIHLTKAFHPEETGAVDEMGDLSRVGTSGCLYDSDHAARSSDSSMRHGMPLPRSNGSSRTNSVSFKAAQVRANNGALLVSNQALLQARKKRERIEKTRIKALAKGPTFFHGNSMPSQPYRAGIDVPAQSAELRARLAFDLDVESLTMARPSTDPGLRRHSSSFATSDTTLGDLANRQGPISSSPRSSPPLRTPGREAGADAPHEAMAWRSVSDERRLRALSSSATDPGDVVFLDRIDARLEDSRMRGKKLKQASADKVQFSASEVLAVRIDVHPASKSERNDPQSPYPRRPLIPSYSAPRLTSSPLSAQQPADSMMAGALKRTTEGSDAAAHKQRRTSEQQRLPHKQSTVQPSLEPATVGLASPRRQMLSSLSAPTIHTASPPVPPASGHTRTSASPPRLMDARYYLPLSTSTPHSQQLNGKNRVFFIERLLQLASHAPQRRTGLGLIFIERSKALDDKKLWTDIENVPRVSTICEGLERTKRADGSVLVLELEAATLLPDLIKQCRASCAASGRATNVANAAATVADCSYCPHFTSLLHYRILAPASMR